MTIETWLLFSGAALVVILIPGPLSLLMISNSLNYGLRRSYPAFLGGVFASICLLSASALGLGALLLASEQVFSALKIVGALYLFYLAWQSWQQSRQPAEGADVPQVAPTPRFRVLFGRAFVLGASNPKDILFFAAFLPQFLSAEQAFLPQLLTMIATWTVLDLLCKLGYGLSAQGAARYLRSGSGQSWFNRVSAALFGCAGVASLIKARAIT
ncbi:LysE family translocator [Pseudomonas sp. R5-89-07]|uniref:LysE family translocator n=1 Tax=Pseudomonas sp. R5-89-07 TaxID=658644 RepID=UPI000F569A02|nr:LysE family translocator [Pseudomonas sp. R5-89-07]AZF06504.1 Homoserine/homoserine lactone efflux protein [Pseudomonas sp. R5-89-07]